ncbi:tRNA wybutosine-synthesizing protein 4 [Elysia marginata]|uniref:tRNA wybutosine-synthesizing protein 4 n=1 Tax=Elysia marginata TaxID=1093978 RepID=A0AAV4G2A8_9GAST|nr:tRNA wybutosine-synthesizing protein 4 [Elysia marginata]
MAKVLSSTTNKNTKTRRETAVQGTNDSSIVSKWSTAACGYFDDSFLQHFISKQSRRAPLIHRGYYIRAKAFDKIIKNFLEVFQDSKKQIDFPELVRRKRLLIENSPELSSLIQKSDLQPSSPHIELSCTDYQLLGIDLTQLNTLEAALKMCGMHFECPTLLLSECVMTYMTRRCSTELVKWAAETFDNGVFGMYEQMHPDDAFGLFMQAHFHSIGSPLKCINAFPSLRSQKERFLNAGWTYCDAVDMNTFYYGCLDMAERQRVESLETFDEYEELNLKYSHYFILTASKVNLGKTLITNNHTLPKNDVHGEITNIVTVSRLPQIDQSVRRFGHASSLVMDRFAITSGGFGETDGRHQRLAELTITDLISLKSYHVSCSAADMQIPRMHHSSVTLSNGATILMAGRQSPFFMCNQMLEVTLQITDNGYESTKSQRVQSSSNFSSPETSSSVPQESCSVPFSSVKRHDRSEDNMNTGEGLSQSDANLEDNGHSDECHSSLTTNVRQPHLVENVISQLPKEDKEPSQCLESHNLSQTLRFKLGTLTIKVVEQSGNVPKERWRHSSVVVTHDGKEHIFLYGGKTKSGSVLQDAFMFNPMTKTWIECTCKGASPGPRHSHSLTFWQGKVILTGGLDENHEPSNCVFCLDLSTMTWDKWNLDGPLSARYSHTAHLHNNMLLLVGGVNIRAKPPGLAVISLSAHTSQEFAFPAQDKESLLMLHRHTSVMMPQATSKTAPQLVLLGGGGNCFSFGTHLNRTPVLIDVEAACSSLQALIAQ